MSAGYVSKNLIIGLIIVSIIGFIVWSKYVKSRSSARRATCIEMLNTCYKAESLFKKENDYYSKTFFYNLNGAVDDTCLDTEKKIFPVTSEMKYYDLGLKAENDVGSIINGRSVLNYPNFIKLSGEEKAGNPNYMNNLGHIPGVGPGEFNCTCRGNIDNDPQVDRVTINQDNEITVNESDL